MKEFVVRTLLTIDFLVAIPIFLALIWRNPDLYADVLAQSGVTIRARAEWFRREHRNKG
jgi:hypothetical protein